jgi:hypothetical protein
MPRMMLAVLITVIALTALAPFGLCPCWLYLHVEQFHPHSPGQAAHPHSHDYLHEIYQSQAAAAIPAAVLPAAVFVLLLAGLPRWRPLPQLAPRGAGWNSPVDAPPPRPCLLYVAALPA